VLFGIRRLGPVGLAMIATSTLDASGRSTQTSVPGGTDVAGFNLDPYGNIVNRFAGSADLTGLTYGAETNRRHLIQVGNGLRVPLPRQPGALL
jgi:uncharacterized protein (TIGR04141 family)